MQAKYFGEVLPYLEVSKNETEDDMEEIIVPNITGLSIKEAEKIVKEIGLDIRIEDNEVDKENTVIKEQIPKEGIRVNNGSKIIVKY